MSAKIDRIKIAGTKYDARLKLSQDQRDAVKLLSKEGYSQRRLATMFRVSRRLIQSILCPPLRSPQPQYSKEYREEVRKRYRERKKELLINGKIKLNLQKNNKKKI